jgi:hypothetical protein
VTRNYLTNLLLGGAVFLAGCGSSNDNNPPPTTDCSEVAPTSLAVGEHTIVDAAQTGCVRLPAAGSSGAEYLYVALSTDGTEAPTGVTADYRLQGATPPAAGVASKGRPSLGRGKKPTVAAAFHARLRERERQLSMQAGGARFDRGAKASVAAEPPDSGSQRTFEVCETTDCDTFVQTTATAMLIGQRVAIYLDDSVPSGGYTQADLQKVGELFDSHLYPIDTTAFGRESDLDNNGVVIVLLTPRVNALTPDCNSTGSVILGYFFGLDLLPSQPHSNDGEVFYGLVPDPGNSGCDISKGFATSFLPPVFIHEFQHMISFNQHVVERNGTAEETWLNEGLSHFAEELGGRLVPDSECDPSFGTCENQFLVQGDIANAYEYLNDTESSFLIEPGNSTGTLAERGANWLFVRWLADHFAATQPIATEFTRSIVQTDKLGVANVEAVTQDDFPTLVSQWQLANYLDNLPGFTPGSDRLQYTSIDFRTVYQQAFTLGLFDKPYPLSPDTAGTQAYDHSGTLRGGSGRHVDVIQDPSAGEVTLTLTGADGSTALPTTVKPRAVIARIR